MFQFGFEGGRCDAAEEFPIHCFRSTARSRNLECIKEGHGSIACNVKSICNGTRMQSFGGMAMSLFEKFAAKEDSGGGAIPGYFILE